MSRTAAKVDPIFLGELALEMHMPVGEMLERMDLHELVSFWPAFFADKRNQQEKVEAERERASRQLR